MKAITGSLLVMALIGLVAVSCSTTSGQIKMKSESVRADVFTEVDGTTAPADRGLADLVIKISIKTDSGDHPLWWVKDTHGTNNYPVVLNIDGQAAIWKGTPQDRE